MTAPDTRAKECADRCQLKEHKGYDTCQQSGECAYKRGPGRPKILRVGGARMTATLDQASYDTAKRLGNGKVNTGLRVALQRCARLDAEAEEVPHATGTGTGESTVG